MRNGFEKPEGRLTLTAAAMVAGGAVVLAALVHALSAVANLSRGFAAGAFGLYLIVGLILIARIAGFHPHGRFGLANTVTLTRFVLTCLLGGITVDIVAGNRRPPAGAAWVFFAIAALALILDALDGIAARRQGLASAFGARFDMEVDALQIFLLSVTAAALDKAGVWVLASGVMRYVFVAAGYIAPWLTARLGFSRRRKVVAAIQGCTLAALLAPVIVPPVSSLAAAAALVLLTYSFGADIVLLRAKAQAS